ncbi:methyltransferase [Microcoleus sp. N3A4]|uniref:methyltransferase n=1 Tax=Microcoleus sp. N3A4 TaxID=3055379 RepID=UPI002FCEA71B
MYQQENFQSSQQISPQTAMQQMITSYWLTQAIYVAAKLDIADLLKDGAKSCEELAIETKVHARSLYRLMRALASVGIFAETEPDYFTLTPLAACLASEVPGSLRALAIMNGEEFYQGWGHLMHSVQTGENAFEHLYGTNLFQYYAQNPEPSKNFDSAMTIKSENRQDQIASSYDFSSIGKLVDVGGGGGSLISMILKANPTMEGVLFDLAPAIESAKELIASKGVAERCQLISGDFFESVPSGGDTYILQNIVHDWDDRRAITILKNCRRAMGDKGKLLLAEMVIPLGNKTLSSFSFLDLNMLVMLPGGSERTEAEYRALFEAAGFQLTKIVPTQSTISLIEGVPV